jgi:hypothetical protein
VLEIIPSYALLGKAEYGTGVGIDVGEFSRASFFSSSWLSIRSGRTLVLASASAVFHSRRLKLGLAKPTLIHEYN